MKLPTVQCFKIQSFVAVNYSNTLRYTKYSIRSNNGVKV